MELLGDPAPRTVLHPFGGKAEVGVRCDLNPEVQPDFLVDAHELPARWCNRFRVVVLDPPYSDAEAKNLYFTGRLFPKKYTAEAVRVCKPGGFVVHYRWYLAPRPEGCSWHSVIAVITRVYHKARVVSVFKKDE